MKRTPRKRPIRRRWSRELRASLENPAVSIQDPEAWAEMFGGDSESAAGVAVSPRKSLGIAAVWQAVSMISGDVAKLPLDVFRRLEDNGREKARTHPSWRVVRRRANREKHAFAFWRDLMTHALIWGNGYAYVARNGRGEVVELLNLLPDRTHPARMGGELVYVTETSREDGSPWLRPLPASDALHIRGISLDGLEGVELVKAAREAWGLALAAQKFASRFFAHGVRAGGVLELPAHMSPKARTTAEEGFRKYHEGESNWFKTVILRDGAKFHQNSMSANEGQMTETREEQVREVARYYNCPPSKFGLTDSVSYNSKSEDNRAYLESTLDTWLCSITYECWSKLLTNAEQQADSHFFEHNTAALLRMNALDRHKVYVMGARARLYTRNEIRAWENLNPVDGGDEFDEFPTTGGIGRPAGGADNERHARQRVAFGLAEHARQKSAKSAAAFLEWVDGGLASHRKRAADLLGDEGIVDEFASRLGELAATVTESDLLAAVEAAAAQLERSVR